jgi:hypothetical protein
MNLFGFTPGEDSFCTETGTGKRGHEKQHHPRNAVQEFSCLYCNCAKASVFLDRCRDYYMDKPGLFDYTRVQIAVLFNFIRFRWK